MIQASTPEKGPPGAEKLSGIIGDIIVNGGFPGLSAATEALIAPYRGKPVTAARFTQLAGQIEKLRAGAARTAVLVGDRKVILSERTMNRAPMFGHPSPGAARQLLEWVMPIAP